VFYAGPGALRADGGGHQHLAPWTEELARYTLIWMVFLGAAVGVRHSRLIALEFGVRKPARAAGIPLRYLVMLSGRVLRAAGLGRGRVHRTRPDRAQPGAGHHARTGLLGDAGGRGADDPEHAGADPETWARPVRHPLAADHAPKD
jgi:hypothetical protein